MKKTLLLIVFALVSQATFAQKEKWDDNKEGWSPLMLAIYKGQNNKVTKLIKHNADVNYITHPEMPGGPKLNALEVAIRIDNEEAIRLLIETNKISTLDESLMLACGYQRASTVTLLIQHSANPSYANQNGHTPGMMAVGFGSLEVLRALLDNGANVNQARGNGGMTMLMYAAFSGEIDKAKLLLEYNADKNIKTKKGDTALDYVNKIYPSKDISEETKAELRKLLQ